MLISVDQMYFLQRHLSQSQAVPFIGPLFISPAKAVVSLLQTITALAAAIFFGLGTLILEIDYFSIITFKAVAHLGMGLFGLGYSIANIATIGILGHHYENNGLQHNQ